MKQYLLTLSVLTVMTATWLYADDYGMDESFKSVGNGAIYNATNQTINLHLTGNGKTYNRSLKAGEVLPLHNHPQYTVRLNNNRNRIVLNVKAFEHDDNPWTIRWYHISRSRRNLLTIESGLPPEWTGEIAAEIKKSIGEFNAPSRP